MTEKQHQCQSQCKDGLQTTSTSIETHKTTRPSLRRAASVHPCISLLPQILLVTVRNAEERERTTFCLAAETVWLL